MCSVVSSTTPVGNTNFNIDSIFVYPTGHIVQINFDHIVGFKRIKNVQVDESDLFCTREISSTLGLKAKLSEFVDNMWRGMKVIRENYVTVIQFFRLILTDWGVTNQQLDELHKRMMTTMTNDDAKARLFRLVNEATTKTMTAF